MMGGKDLGDYWLKYEAKDKFIHWQLEDFYTNEVIHKNKSLYDEFEADVLHQLSRLYTGKRNKK